MYDFQNTGAGLYILVRVPLYPVIIAQVFSYGPYIIYVMGGFAKRNLVRILLWIFIVNFMWSFIYFS